MRRITTLALIFAAGPAMATCPTRADLREGIVLVQNEPIFIRADIELRPDGFNEVRLITDADEVKSVVTLTYDHALAPMSVNEGGEVRLLSYTGDTGALDDLARLGDVSLSLTEVSMDEETTRPVLFNHVGDGTRGILDCTYDTWTIRVMEAGATGEIDTREVEYAPEIGAILSERRITPDGDETLYDYTWIGTSADVAR